jgi:hypothetical protein
MAELSTTSFRKLLDLATAYRYVKSRYVASLILLMRVKHSVCKCAPLPYKYRAYFLTYFL